MKKYEMYHMHADPMHVKAKACYLCSDVDPLLADAHEKAVALVEAKVLLQQAEEALERGRKVCEVVGNKFGHHAENATDYALAALACKAMAAAIMAEEDLASIRAARTAEFAPSQPPE
jgi:hypothetical protein